MLKDKIIVVTGGRGLLGSRIIDLLRHHGGVVINADISCENNVEFHDYHCDITNEESVHRLVDDIVTRFGRIDGWINNAYPRTRDWHKKFEDIPFESWRRNIDMHLNGYFLCSQYALRQMKLQNGGLLINMASIYGIVGPDFSIYEGTQMTMPAAYSAIKGGIISLTRYLAAYYGEYNIRVNCISPGGVFDHQEQSFLNRYTNKVPLKRMGTPEDIANIILFLLSPLSSYVTGHNLVVDGGWTAI